MKIKVASISGLLLMFFSLAFDFRSDPIANTTAVLEDPLLFQLALNVVFIAGFIWLIIIAVHKNNFAIRLESEITPLLKLWVFFFLMSVVAASVNMIPVILFIKTFYPFILAGLGMMMVNILITKGVSEKEIVNIIVGASFVSVVWAIIRVVVIGDVPLSGVRYRILGAGFPVVVAYVISLYFTTKGVRKTISLLGIVSVFVLITISQTRSWIVVLILAFMTMLFFVRGGRTPLVVFSSLLLLFIVLLSPMLELPIVDAFIARIFEQRASSGVDVTVLTRLAEYTSQYSQLTESLHHFMTGRGYGATYYYDISYFDQLKRYTNADVFEEGNTFLGHSLWIYSLFTGGLISGWVIPLVLIRSLYKSWKVLGFARFEGITTGSPLLFTIFLSLLIYVLMAFISHPFGHRFDALCIGSFMALAYYNMGRIIKPLNKSPYTSRNDKRNIVLSNRSFGR